MICHIITFLTGQNGLHTAGEGSYGEGEYTTVTETEEVVTQETSSSVSSVAYERLEARALGGVCIPTTVPSKL